MKKNLLWAAVVLIVLMAACQNPSGGGGGGGDGDTSAYVLPYSPYQYKVLKSKFTSSAVNVDGRLDEAVWGQAESSQISYVKHPANPADGTGGGASGTVKSVWDGYTLYIAVDVLDNSPANDTWLEGTNTNFGGPTITAKSNGAYGIMGAMDYTTFQSSPYNSTFDNVEFAIDFWNDKQDKWADDDGLFAISRSGKLTYDNSGGFGTDEGTYSSVFASPDAREYNNRVKAYKVTEKTGGRGYIVELAIEIYGAKPANGTGFGVDVMISDSPSNDTARTSRTYWSHNDNSYRFSSRDGNLDWGTIVLTGHNDSSQDDFAKSEWMLANAIRWVDRNLPGTTGYVKSDFIYVPVSGGYPPPAPTDANYIAPSVAANWSGSTWTVLDNAIQQGRALNTASATQQEIKTKAQAIEAAIAGLIAADDPLGATAMTAPVTNTLPDPLVFKTNSTGGTTGSTVQNTTDWAKRAEEIRQLASVYEYGPKPGSPASVTVTKVSAVPGFGAHWEPAPWYYPNRPPIKVDRTPGSYSIEATVTYNGGEASVPAGAAAVGGNASLAFNLYTPSLAAGAKAPVLLNFDGNQSEFTDNGVAVMGIPINLITTDDRTNGVWQTRGGTFRQFYPYGSRGQRYEISNEMGAAWGASRAVDALIAAKTNAITSQTVTISIDGGQTTYDQFTIKDRMTVGNPPANWWEPDNRVWWRVGQLAGNDNLATQQGSGKATMLYLMPGSPAPAAGGSITFTTYERMNAQGQWDTVDVPENERVTVTLTLGAETTLTEKLGDLVDENQLAVTGYSINGKYAFVSALYDERIKVAIPGASGATGPQAWRYNPAGTVYSAGKGNIAGGELIGDNIMKNPGRATEIFRRFLTHFNYYEQMRGIDAHGDFSHGFAQRLPYDGHELVASMFPRVVIERAVMNDFNDGSEQDAIGLQAARLVYRYLMDKGASVTTAGGTTIDKAGIDKLLVFNYHQWAPFGDPHGAVSSLQRVNEALYMNWYFKGGTDPVYLTASDIFDWNVDPFFTDVLVSGGSNSYERHYGGFPVMMPWSWAGPYYPSR
ncbi:MAG: CBM9 family sugar-binding protein [Treponema sp.]|jgi:hypothetical protein|nr:CBM9 family sugar-binding protein [Treponema sp.]